MFYRAMASSKDIFGKQVRGGNRTAVVDFDTRMGGGLWPEIEPFEHAVIVICHEGIGLAQRVG